MRGLRYAVEYQHGREPNPYRWPQVGQLIFDAFIIVIFFAPVKWGLVALSARRTSQMRTSTGRRCQGTPLAFVPNSPASIGILIVGCRFFGPQGC